MKYVYFLAFHFTSYFAGALPQSISALTDTILLQDLLQRVHNAISTDAATISHSISSMTAESYASANISATAEIQGALEHSLATVQNVTASMAAISHAEERHISTVRNSAENSTLQSILSSIGQDINNLFSGLLNSINSSEAIQALAESFVNALVNLVNTAGSAFYSVPGFQELLETLGELTKIIPN